MSLQKIREAARAAEERARAAEEKLDKVKNPAAHKVNFLFGEVRGLVERLEQALEELQQSDEAAREKFAKVIADWLHDAYGFGPERLQKFFEAFPENSDELAKMRAEVDDDYAFEKLRLRAEDVSRMDIRYYGKLKID